VQEQLFAVLQKGITALAELSCKVELGKRRGAVNQKGNTHPHRPQVFAQRGAPKSSRTFSSSSASALSSS
jgi:hypothetical protein